ncbi:putative ubiquinol-cytochrome c reductase complex 11 kDa [Pyrrhoderma noxium]|uniref:Cytochrome b-c1 complex subunit 8 n=1 Tax=Pyrrhoderma noxium TaxID=2282107 RepID=A0A286UE82_9AGAM|nr:putative ubiquinol-cytochrome c reductase complex 11 kDa [Pyrrhoderma noxium]
MRPTSARMLGEMPGGKHYMGWWGDMGSPKQKGIITYAQSPFRQAPMRGAFQGYLFGGFSRIATQLPYIAIPFGLGYAVYTYAKRVEAWNNSKAGHLALMEAGGEHH